MILNIHWETGGREASVPRQRRTSTDTRTSASRHFQPGKGPSRGILRDCENFADGLFAVPPPVQGPSTAATTFTPGASRNTSVAAPYPQAEQYYYGAKMGKKWVKNI